MDTPTANLHCSNFVIFHTVRSTNAELMGGVNNAIGFINNCNPNLLAKPLVEQLFSVKGCKLSTVEVMMKFHRADAKARRCIISQMDESKVNDLVQSDRDTERTMHN